MTRSLEGLLVGRTLAERYAIEEVIGRGGMSVVYRATDQRLGRPVAVKIVSLPAGPEERGDLRARLKREAASAARIPPHPHVVQVYDYGTDPELDLDFIVMELLRGRDLRQAIREGGLGYAESIRILREAARGLAAGHRAGIVHRDVKPANVFLSGEERFETVKILDFGIAKALEVTPDDELTRTGVLPHSPAYASPEQLRGSSVLSPASDVYQLGFVAYELLAGERPFGESDRERIRAGEGLEPPDRGRWSSLPAEVREVVSRAMRPRPEERYPDAAILAEALAGVPERAPGDGAEGAGVASEPGARPAPAVGGERGGAPGARPEERAISPDEEVTLLAEEAIPELPPAPDEGAAVEPARGRWTRRLPIPGRRMQVAGAAVLALLGFWAIARLGEDEPAVEAAEEAPVEQDALAEEFRPLMVEAAERLWEAEGTGEGAAAAEEVRQVIADLNAAWVQGDLERHVSHYAERVDFYNADDARRSRIARERGEALESFPDREITIERTAVTFPEPGRARALVDKSWRFGGGEEEWEGSARQELILELERGRWRVVAERDAEVYRSERG